MGNAPDFMQIAIEIVQELTRCCFQMLKALVLVLLLLLFLGQASANIMPMSNKVKIDVHKQQELLIIEREKCMQLAERTPNGDYLNCNSDVASEVVDETFCVSLFSVTGRCPVFWDEIMCWPQSEANTTVSLLCPNYVDMFNIKNQATKHCAIPSQPDQLIPMALWSRTNFSSCLKDAVDDHFKVLQVT